MIWCVLLTQIFHGLLELINLILEIFDVAVVVGLPGLDVPQQLIHVLRFLSCELVSHHINLNCHLLDVRVLLLLLPPSLLLVPCELFLLWSPLTAS